MLAGIDAIKLIKGSFEFGMTRVTLSISFFKIVVNSKFLGFFSDSIYCGRSYRSGEEGINLRRRRN
jgi:hypothetical protein